MGTVWRSSLAGYRFSGQLLRFPFRALATSPFNLSGVLVKSAEKSTAQKRVNITWRDNTCSSYPYIYLRDNCQCPDCFFKESNQRLVNVVKDVDINIVPTKVRMNEEGTQVSIMWPDGHVSALDADWLFKKRLPEEHELKKNECNDVTTRKVELWGSELEGKLPTMKFGDILNDESVQFDWLNCLYRYGVALVTEAPAQIGQIEKLGELVGYMRLTAYGKTAVVSSREAMNSVAYTNYTLPLHSDLPYYECKPGIQMLHCIEQIPTQGGETTLVDSFHVSQQLKKEDPQAFEMLTTTHVLFQTGGKDVLGDYDLQGARPLIELDHHGRLLRINHNEGTRQCFLGVSADKTHEMYEAFYSLTRRLQDSKNMITHRLSPGEVMTLDNDRVLHGRTGFSLEGEGGRCLESGYLDWDVARSKLNVLGVKLNKGPVARMDSVLSVTGQWAVD